VIDPLDRSRASDVGVLLAEPDEPDEVRTDWTALATAHVVALCRVRGWAAVTDGTARVHALDPRIEVKLLRRR
jgi:hypothetical protein